MELTKIAIGSFAPDFELKGVDDRVHRMAEYLAQNQLVVIVFMCNHCPFVRAYWSRMLAIQDDYRDRGVQLLGINANDDRKYPDDSFENMKGFAQEQGMTFPYLRDASQDVAKAFGAEYTPEVFAVDRDWVVQYTGRIDDNHLDAKSVQSADLRYALDEILASGTVSDAAAVTQAIGCSLKWKATD